MPFPCKYKLVVNYKVNSSVLFSGSIKIYPKGGFFLKDRTMSKRFRATLEGLNDEVSSAKLSNELHWIKRN